MVYTIQEGKQWGSGAVGEYASLWTCLPRFHLLMIRASEVFSGLEGEESYSAVSYEGPRSISNAIHSFVGGWRKGENEKEQEANGARGGAGARGERRTDAASVVMLAVSRSMLQTSAFVSKSRCLFSGGIDGGLVRRYVRCTSELRLRRHENCARLDSIMGVDAFESCTFGTRPRTWAIRCSSGVGVDISHLPRTVREKQLKRTFEGNKGTHSSNSSGSSERASQKACASFLTARVCYV